jgi:hypothetical protein
MSIFILCSLLWWVTGSAGYCYWWTNEYDLRTDDIPMAVLTGILGPMAWFVGWSIHGNSQKTIFHKRRG